MVRKGPAGQGKADAADPVEWLEPKDLSLDARNPRLSGQAFTIDDQEAIIDWLWRNKSVSEVLESIVAQGYWPHEELFAAREDGRLVVIEGNRRLAAVLLLLDESRQERLKITGLKRPPKRVLGSVARLPVVVRPRKEIWAYVGFKHLNGPQEWDSISKAEYIHRTHHGFGVSLSDIARTIGDENQTVVRLHRGYSVLRQAEEAEIFDRHDSMSKKFPFSHLWTAIGYTGVQKFLGLTQARFKQDRPVPKKHEGDLGDLMFWLFGSRSEGIQPCVKRQTPDLRELIECLSNKQGLMKLRAGLPLSIALEASKGDEKLFEDALVEAEAKLKEAKRFVATGYDGDEGPLDTARAILTIAQSLHKEMADHHDDDSEF